MRRKLDRPTLIYWLIDTRPETIAAGYHSGYPFYCGKTVDTAHNRLLAHKLDTKRYPHRASCQYVAACGDNIRIQIMEIVPPEVNWCEREKRWISTLRFSFPGATNKAAGGQGMTGLIPSAETREKMRAARLGKKRSPEIVAKIAASNRGKTHSTEAREKIGAKNRGRKASEETRAKMRAARLGRKHSPETRDKIGNAHRGKIVSPETRAKISVNNAMRRAANA